MKETTRKFNITFDELRFKVGDVVGYMTRDEAEFVGRGITTLMRDAFETEGNAFEVFPTDDYFQGQVTIEVQAKNAARESTMAKVRVLASQVQQIFGDKSGQYKMLGMKDLNKKSDGLFITLARGVAKVGEDYLTELSEAGLTQGQLDALMADAQLMEDKFHAIKSKEAQRDNKTEERVNLANALYDKLSKYCAIGKSIWEGISEAKYNDYVINPTVHSGLAKPHNLMAELDPNDPSIATLSWDAVSGANSYKIYYSMVPDGQPSGEFVEIEEVFGVNQTTALIDFQNRNYWKIRAFGGGKSSGYSDEVFIQT